MSVVLDMDAQERAEAQMLADAHAAVWGATDVVSLVSAAEQVRRVIDAPVFEPNQISAMVDNLAHKGHEISIKIAEDKNNPPLFAYRAMSRISAEVVETHSVWRARGRKPKS